MKIAKKADLVAQAISQRELKSKNKINVKTTPIHHQFRYFCTILLFCYELRICLFVCVLGNNV